MKYLVYRCANDHVKLRSEFEAIKDGRLLPTTPILCREHVANYNDDDQQCGEILHLLGTIDVLPFPPVYPWTPVRS